MLLIVQGPRLVFDVFICTQRVKVNTVVFGRPFLKLFALRYHSVVCSVCLSVTLVYCGQTV